LGGDAKLSIDQDALSTPDEKKADKAWLIQVLQEGATAGIGKDFDQRATIADFILSGKRGP
jgi:hypothetical protein